MKLNVGKRIVLFFHWLLSLLIAIAAFGGEFVGKLYAKVGTVVDAQYLKIAMIAFIVIYAILSLTVLVMLFKRSGSHAERGFITMDDSDNGKVRISVGAIEQMVKQAAGTVDGIADMRIAINSLDDAIAINVNVSIVNGSHVPTVTMNMQRAIRQFVELNCGVAVRSVSISVQTVVNPGESSRKGRKGELKAVPAVLNETAPVTTEETVEEVFEEAPVSPVEEVTEQVYEQPAPIEQEVVFEETFEKPVQESETFEPAEESEENEFLFTEEEESSSFEDETVETESETAEICSEEAPAEEADQEEEKI